MNIEQWASQFGSDIAAFGLSVCIVLLYYLWLRSKVKANPTFSIHGVNQLARSLWVENVMKNPSKDVMAVQTLRNFIMGASLMASTATLLIIGTLTLSGQAESISRTWHILNIGGNHSAELWIDKVLCLLVDFIVAFFAFVMAVRLVNHVVFMINAPGTDAHHNLTANAVAKRLNRAGNMFATGTRAFFFAVPLAFWLFGPVFLVIATLGLVVALVHLDRSEPE
jgi:uncharacterized membrane protein